MSLFPIGITMFSYYDDHNGFVYTRFFLLEQTRIYIQSVIKIKMYAIGNIGGL